jgi:hypothetical protein
MSDGRVARWSPVSGAVFVALLLAGIVLVGDVPGADSSDAEIRSYFADHGNQVKLQIAYFIATLAAVSFLWFVGLLAARVRQAEGEASWLSRIVVASGAASALVMLAGFAAESMVAATADHTSRFHVDPDTARVITDFGYPLTFETGLPLAAPLVLPTTLAFRRAQAIPRWLGPAGLVVAAACVVGFLGVPMGLFLGWVVVVVVLLLRRAPRPDGREAPRTAAAG